MGKIYYDRATNTYSDRPITEDSPLRRNLPDHASRGPGAKFPTVDAAAADGLDHSRAQKDQFMEYGGWIVRDPSGGFTYTEVLSSRACSKFGKVPSPGKLCLGPPPPQAVAAFHTHPRSGSDSQVNGTQEQFSAGDRAAAEYDRDQGMKPGYLYLHTPYGRVRRFDPNNDESKTLRGPALPNEGKGGK